MELESFWKLAFRDSQELEVIASWIEDDRRKGNKENYDLCI